MESENQCMSTLYTSPYIIATIRERSVELHTTASELDVTSCVCKLLIAVVL